MLPKTRLVRHSNIGYIYRSLVRRRIKSDLPSLSKKLKVSDDTYINVGGRLGIIIEIPEDKYIIYDGRRLLAIFLLFVQGKYLKSDQLNTY